jgi:hypothetical protein
VADHGKLKASGRSFDCNGCQERVQKLRRCREDREDFGHNDGAAWPMVVDKGGSQFGFCPAKATWDRQAVYIFQLLQLAAETGATQYVRGGLVDQPEWWVNELSWFVPRYKMLQFISRAKMVLGDGSKGVANGNVKGRPVNKNRV